MKDVLIFTHNQMPTTNQRILCTNSFLGILANEKHAWRQENGKFFDSSFSSKPFQVLLLLFPLLHFTSVPSFPPASICLLFFFFIWILLLLVLCWPSRQSWATTCAGSILVTDSSRGKLSFKRLLILSAFHFSHTTFTTLSFGVLCTFPYCEFWKRKINKIKKEKEINKNHTRIMIHITSKNHHHPPSLNQIIWIIFWW